MKPPALLGDARQLVFPAGTFECAALDATSTRANQDDLLDEQNGCEEDDEDDYYDATDDTDDCADAGRRARPGTSVLPHHDCAPPRDVWHEADVCYAQGEAGTSAALDDGSANTPRDVLDSPLLAAAAKQRFFTTEDNVGHLPEDDAAEDGPEQARLKQHINVMFQLQDRVDCSRATLLREAVALSGCPDVHVAPGDEEGLEGF